MATFQADVLVLPKEGVRDPEGTQVLQHLEAAIGEHTVAGLTAGKFFRLKLTAGSSQAAAEQVNLACRKYLTNPILQSYELTLLELDD